MSQYERTPADVEAEHNSDNAKWGAIDLNLPLHKVNPDAAEALTSTEYIEQIARGAGELAATNTTELVVLNRNPDSQQQPDSKPMESVQ